MSLLDLVEGLQQWLAESYWDARGEAYHKQEISHRLKLENFLKSTSEYDNNYRRNEKTYFIIKTAPAV